MEKQTYEELSKHQEWKSLHPQWWKTYKRLKTNEERAIRRQQEVLSELDSLHVELNRLKSKVGVLIGRLKKSNQV